MTPILTALRTVLLGLAFVAGLALPALAQLNADARAYYQDWLKTAARAEEVIDAKRASSAALETLRVELTTYRQNFLDARTGNGDRIITLEGQLSALGPAPGDGESEPEDIANLRASLEQQLNDLKVPRIVSEEAYSRADGLISEIDTIIRERRTRILLERGPSPLNPENWSGALRALNRSGSLLWNETANKLSSQATAERIRHELPVLLILLAIAALLILRGRSWARAAGIYLRRFGSSGRGVWSFVVSLLEVVLPFIGIICLTAAVELSGILGIRGTLLLDYVPGWALLILSFHWLGNQLFSSRIENDLVPVQEGRLNETRLMVDILAVILVLQDALRQLDVIESIPAEAHAVASFPLITAAALVLLRLHRIGVKQRQKQTSTTAEEDGAISVGANRLMTLVRRATYLLGFVSPVLAVLGYVNAAEALIYPAVSTLALLAALMVFQRFLGDVYGWLSGAGSAARDSLFSVLIGFVLVALAIPMLALIWGARIADLTELWSKFLEGFQIGDARISPTAFLSFAVVFAIGYTLTRLVQGSLRNSLLPKTKIDPGGQNAITAGLGYVGIFLSAVIAISTAGLNLSSLAIVAGALSVGIGFGLQTIVSNFVSGIILLIERPISKGDWIEVGGLMGYVRDISVRSTRIETFDRSDVIVPNSDLISGTVTNYTRGNTVGRVIVPVGVAYGTDPRKIEAILLDIAKAHPMVLLNPAPYVVFQGFGADSLDFEIRAILRDVNWVLSVKSDMNYEIARRFGEEGIEIPFAQRDIWIRNPEALASGTPEAAKQAPQPTAAPMKPDLGDMQDAGGEGDADK
ncbi:mechanosensitive ion channel protein MscS [Rhodobacteraceae bacterium (ex Bugula neritina AB1)]|nr:mechanosensitive ion channel protein MscS [Rhodobacteraceae bacterium (ex Bugula neritina AB1)]